MSVVHISMLPNEDQEAFHAALQRAGFDLFMLETLGKVYWMRNWVEQLARHLDGTQELPALTSDQEWSTYDADVNKKLWLLRDLNDFGLRPEMLGCLMADNQLMRRWVGWLRGHLYPVLLPRPELFSAPEELLAAFVQKFGKNRKLFSIEQIDQLKASMPTGFISSQDNVLTLDIWLGTVPSTFEDLWRWCNTVHGKGRLTRNGEISTKTSAATGEDRMQLTDRERYGDVPAVRWAVVDMIVGRTVAPIEFEHRTPAPGFSVLAAIALHPRWASAIDGGAVPGVYFPGITALTPTKRSYFNRGAVHVTRSEYDGSLKLISDYKECQSEHLTNPIFKELII